MPIPSKLLTKPDHFDFEKVIRPNILTLRTYRCARDDYQEGVLLDANENALGHSINASAPIPAELRETLSIDLHRYPNPAQIQIKSSYAKLRNIPGPEYVFLGVGSDEVIDLLMRVCVAPGREKILTTPPSYGMYPVCAQVNDIEVVKCPLELSGDKGEGGDFGRFSVRVEEVKKVVDNDPTIKLIFLCSPGNPTGTVISLNSLRTLLEYEKFKGIIVVDEAYIDFAGNEASAASLVTEYANLCVMQTLSKGFGLAAIRVGVAIAQPPLIQILTNTKAPYNISGPSAQLARNALSPASLAGMRSKADQLVSSRQKLLERFSQPDLTSLGLGSPIGGNNANFILIPILNRETKKPDNARSNKLYKTLAEEKGVVVRYRGGETGCEGCLRITVGSAEENVILVEKLLETLGEI